MENNPVLMMKDKLEFFGIIKESLKLIPRNTSFIILTFLTSFPYFCFLLFLEINFQQPLIDAIKSKLTTPTYDDPFGKIIDLSWQPRPIDVIRELILDVFLPSLLPGLLYLGMAHLLHLLNTITTVYSASMVYAGEGTANLKEMLCRPFRTVGLKGPLITSTYALILSTLTLIGILSLSTHFFVTSSIHAASIFKTAFGLAIIALLTKYIEWSAIWNMGMVISILDEKHGDVALGVSAYISRGCRKRGFLSMLVFFVWWVSFRLICVYGVWTESISLVMVSVGEVFSVCVGNVMKWVVFTVYFYDCKKRFLEKKVDVEQGRSAERV
ncbi:uncharacterized protein LOC8280543 [Ricinus communis]|uniref:Transmembrane protein n=1 Tax=Ricinus communis TaxID=3988 RepID=B9RUB6_RICCO|nr:uncharacterized protein LOC8280543 [Ricinus communis]EEF44903.1 conserved hypothetical protein [Ricinus communis]|eukprot:XP_002517361.1 uncharacterized protein LOC8280543 [Ricinus communis]